MFALVYLKFYFDTSFFEGVIDFSEKYFSDVKDDIYEYTAI